MAGVLGIIRGIVMIMRRASIYGSHISWRVWGMIDFLLTLLFLIFVSLLLQKVDRCFTVFNAQVIMVMTKLIAIILSGSNTTIYMLFFQITFFKLHDSQKLLEKH